MTDRPSATTSHDLRGVEELVTIFDALFGCWHKRMSFPLTRRNGRQRPGESGTYVVCLDCGQEFAYDWQNMRMLSPVRRSGYVRTQVEIEAKAS
jgi:hypothetical protein